MKNNENGKIYFFQPHPSKAKTFTPIKEIQSNFDLLKSIELGTGKAIGISSNDELLEWKNEKKAPKDKKNQFPFLSAKPVYHFHKIKFSKVLINKTMCLGLDINGSVLVWGEHKDGLIGLGYTMTSVDNPTRIECLKDIVDIALSNNHAIAINSIGEAFSWGTGKYGELGLDKSIYTPTPLRVNSSKTYLKAIVGNLITCFLDSDGHFSYYGVIIKILKGTFSLITIKNLLNDQSNSNPDTLFQEKIIVELEQEAFSSVLVGNGFIALLSKNGMVYTLEHSDKLTALYSKYYVYSLTVSNNQIIGLSYEKHCSTQTQRTTQSNKQHRCQLAYYFCQWTSKASEKDFSNEIWTTLIYKITEDLHLDSIALLNSNNSNVILIIEKGVNLNASVFFNNNNTNKSNMNISNDISWENITCNEIQVNTLGIMKKHSLSSTFLLFECEYDDSYNMKFKRSKSNQEKRAVSPLLNRTLRSDNKSTIQYNHNNSKSCSSALLCTYSERDTNKRLLTNSTVNNHCNNNESESVEAKESQLKHYQNEIDCIISNFKLRQKEKTTTLKQKITNHQHKEQLNVLDISNSIESKRRHSSLISNPNNTNHNNQKSLEKNLQYTHLDTSNANIEMRNNLSDIDGFSNKTPNDNSNNNTLMKNELYSDIEEVNIFNKSSCNNVLDDSSQLKLSSNFLFINPNKSNFLSPQFIKTSKFAKLYSSKEHSPSVTMKITQKNLDKEILSKLKMSANELCGMVNSDSNIQQLQQQNYEKYKQMAIKGSHCNTEANDLGKDTRLDTQSTVKNKKSKGIVNSRSFSNDKIRIPNSHHKRNANNVKEMKQNKPQSNKPETDSNDCTDKHHLQQIQQLKERDVITAEADKGDLIPENGPNKERQRDLKAKSKAQVDDLNKMSTIAYMENSSNFAYSNDNLFEETPKFDSKKVLLHDGSGSQRKNYQYHIKGDHNANNYTQRTHLLNDIQDSNINATKDNEGFEEDNKEVVNTNTPLIKPLNNISDRASIINSSSNRKVNSHETSIRQMNDSSNRSKSQNKGEEETKQSNGFALQGSKLDFEKVDCIKSIQSLTVINDINEEGAIRNNKLQLNEDPETKESNNLLFSLGQNTADNNTEIKQGSCKMKDYYDIISEVNKNKLSRKTMPLNFKSLSSNLKKDDDYDGKNNESNDNSNNLLFQSEEDLKANFRRDKLNNYNQASNDKSTEVRYISDKKKNSDHDNEGENPTREEKEENDKESGEYNPAQQDLKNQIKKNIKISNSSENKEAKEHQNDGFIDQNDKEQLLDLESQHGKSNQTINHNNKEKDHNCNLIQENLLSKIGASQSNITIFQKENSPLSTSPCSKCKINPVENSANNNRSSKLQETSNSSYIEDKSNANSIFPLKQSNDLKATPQAFSLTKIMPNQNHTKSSNDYKASVNIFNYKSSILKEELIVSQLNNNNNDTARLGENEEDELDEKHFDENNNNKSSNINNSQCTPSDDSQTHKNDFLIQTTSKEHKNQNDYRISTIKDKIKSEENQDKEENENAEEGSEATLTHKQFCNTTSTYSNAKTKLNFDSNTKKQYLSIEASNKQNNAEVISKLLSKSNHYYLDQKEKPIHHDDDDDNNSRDDADEEITCLQRRNNIKKTTGAETVKTDLDLFSSDNLNYNQLDYNNNNKSAYSPKTAKNKQNENYKRQLNHLPKDPNYRLSSIPPVKGMLINPEDTFGINDSSSIDKEAKKNQSITDEKKSVSPDIEGTIKPEEITFLPSTEKKTKNSLSIKIPSEELLINMPRRVLNLNEVDQDLSSNSNINNGHHILENNNSNLTEQKIFTLKGYFTENDSSLQHNASNNTNNTHNTNTNNNTNNNNNNNAITSHYIDNKLIENDINENKPSDRIIQLISKIKNSQNQIETSMTQGQTLLKKPESYIETEGTNPNKNKANPFINNENFYTFNNNAQLNYPNNNNPNQSNCISNSNLQQLNEQNTHLRSKIMITSESNNESNGKQKTRNSQYKANKKNINKKNKELRQESHEYSNYNNNGSKKQLALGQISKEIKLSTEPNYSSKDIGNKKYKMNNPNQSHVNCSNDSIAHQENKSIRSKGDTPSYDKGERSSLVSLLSETKSLKAKDKGAISLTRRNQKEKNVFNKNTFNYFSFLVSGYMQKQVVNYCIRKICICVFLKERIYSCRLLSRVVKRKLIFYEIKFFHRCIIVF